LALTFCQGQISKAKAKAKAKAKD